MKKNCGLGNNIFWCFYESIIIGARLVEKFRADAELKRMRCCPKTY
ncbi:unnamed protein product [Moneuplotes crassus]|uniref:Uncharacterized protein n=1 Tax=Euplotes crassus TaxID=5936 RepID=A0AAD1Y4L7_EUPCR|nr:unnamed protein product [Moneuplotes crassus]